MLKLNNKAKDLDNLVKEGEGQVKEAKLVFKHKVLWCRGLAKFAEAVLKELPKSPTTEKKPEEKQSKVGAKRSHAEVSAPRSKTAWPKHDFVQAPVVKSDRKHKKTPLATPKGEFVLRTSMLSARLRERFGYLCTGDW